jgi:hypothetical protein
MSETLLQVGSQAAVMIVLRDVMVRPGLALTRLIFTFEIATKQPGVVSCPAWFSGRVEFETPNARRLHIASFDQQQGPLTLPSLGVDHVVQLGLEISERQLQLIEDNRVGGVTLAIALVGYVTQDGENVPINQAEMRHVIGQSDWLIMLERAGYQRRILLELEAPDRRAHPDLAAAIDYYLQAQRRFGEGEWRLTVESLRQALASLVGKKAEEEDDEADAEGALRTLRNESRANRVGYERRAELVRQAAKFMCDLGAHPEVTETRKHDAYAALVIVGGLLHAFAKT